MTMQNILILERNSFLAKFPKVDAKRQTFWDDGLKDISAKIQTALPEHIRSSNARAIRIAEISHTKCLN